MTPEEIAAFMAEEDETPPPPKPAPPKKASKPRAKGEAKPKSAPKKRSSKPTTPEQRRKQYQQKLKKEGLGDYADDLADLKDIFGDGNTTLGAPLAGPVRYLHHTYHGLESGLAGETRALNILFRSEEAGDLVQGVDPVLYQRALPALMRIYQRKVLQENDLRGFRSMIREQMGPAATPYVTQFVMDLQRGIISPDKPLPNVVPPQDPPVIHKPAAIEYADATDELQGNNLYLPYQNRLVSTGAKPHPGKLVESASLAAVTPPPLTYHPNLPADIVANGAVSQPQIDAIAANGQAHEQWLPADKDGVVRRQGFLTGDGPGTGKTHIILGILKDNQRQGRPKSIVLSMKNDLFHEMRDIWRTQFSGRPREEFRSIGNVKLGAPVDPNFQGTMLATYRMLQKPGRVKQLIEWFGEDYDGVILFDESHAAAKSIGSRQSQSAVAMRALERALPKARVSYFSATSASKVKEMGYAERLGLWGEGTDFADARQFAQKMRNANLATLEMIARDMKALGIMTARNLDWSDVRVERPRHRTLPDQQQGYDYSTEIWRQIHKGLKDQVDAMQRQFGIKATQPFVKGMWQRHHGVVQQFYQQVLAGMQMPTVIQRIQADLAAGRSPVIQLAQTYEQQLDRELDGLPPEALATHHFSAATLMRDYLLNHWPTYVLESYTDENHQPQVRVAENPDGSKVIDEVKVFQRDALLHMVNELNEVLPANPLDQLLDAFGEEKIAEVTGRTSRLMRAPTGQRFVQKRKKSDINADSAAYRAGTKPILVYTSAKAGTGFSFHSGMNFGNQLQRAHYILETGWDPIVFYQSLNRTHRSNQAHPPVIYLVDTDVPGHQRIISTMAKGLQQIGALTQGERGALAQGGVSAQGLFSERDNLESREAEEALAILYQDILNLHLQGMDPKTFEELSGFDLEDEKPSMVQFLNRMLAMPVASQRALFNAFNTRLDAVLTDAIQEGTVDVGLQQLAADTTEVIEEHELATYDVTGAKTGYVKLRRFNKVYPMDYNELLNRLDVLQMEGSAEGHGQYMGMVQAPRGKIYAAVTSHPRTDIKTGQQTDMMRLIAADGEEQRVTLDRYTELYAPLEMDETDAWSQAIAELPPHKKSITHLVTGLLLPYWSRLGEGNQQARHRVVQVTATQAGRQRRLLGRVIPQQHIANLLIRFGVGRNQSLQLGQADFSPSEVYTNLSETDGAYMTLDDGTFLMAALDANGQPVIQVSNLPAGQVHQLAQLGVKFDLTNMGPVGRLPLGEDALRIISSLMEKRTIQDAVGFRAEEASWIEFRAPATPPGGNTPTPGPTTPANTPTPPAPAPFHPTNKAGYRKDRSASEIASGMDEWLEEGFIPPAPAPAKGAAPTTAPYVSANPQIEDFISRNKRPPQRGFWERAKETFEKKKNQVTREFEHLPNTGYFMPARDQLLMLNAQIGVSIKTAMTKIGNLYRHLTPQEYDIVSRLLVMQDALENIDLEAQEALEAGLPPRAPQGLGWSRENVEAEITALQAIISASPAMTQTVENRKKAWDKLKLEYIEANLALGIDVSEKFTRDFYFRHWVQDTAQFMGVGRSVQDGKLNANRSPGYLRHRGEQFKEEMTTQGLVITPTYDYATDLVAAEFEVMSKMLYHIQVAAGLKFFQEQYDLRPHLEAEAMARNEEHVLAHFEKIADAINAQAGPLAKLKSGAEVMRNELGRDLAIAFQRLFALANDGLLPSAPHFDDLIDAMAMVYYTRQHATTRAEQEARLPDKFMPQLFVYLNWVRGLTPGAGGIVESQSAVGQWFKARASRERKIEEAIAAEGAKVLTWEDIYREKFKDTHQIWQASEGAVFYMGNTVADNIAQQLSDGQVERIGITKDMLHKAMIRGQQRRQMVLDNEIAMTLDQFSKRLQDGFWSGPIAFWTRKLKSWTLNNPKRFFEVQARNASGDLEIVLAANPWILTKVRQAVTDLYHAFVLEEGMKGDLLSWYQHGGLVATFNKAELADTDHLHEVMNLVAQGPNAGMGAVARWQRLMANFAKPEMLTPSGSWKSVLALYDSMKDVADFREGILRYAAYLYALEDIRSNGGKPRSYWASIREEIDGLAGNPQAQAWHLSNSLLGAYDRVGQAGQEARKFVLWFWSFQELNLRRYTRLLKNAMEDDQLLQTIGRKALAKAANPMAYYRVGKVLLGAHALMALTGVWNFLFFHDEEEELPPYVRERPHLIFGRNADGTIRVITRLGSFADYASWFGADVPQTTIRRLMSNNESILQIALDTALSPVKNLVGAVNPTVKLPAELLTGQKFFPDPFEPRSIRNRMEYLLQGFGLEDFYTVGSAITGRAQPGSSFERTMFDAIGNSYEPKMGIIGEARDLERKFLKSIGQAPPLLVYTPKNNALWAMRKATRLGDMESARYWLMQYFKLGGTRQGLKRSIEAGAPMGSMSEAERGRFFLSLSPRERRLVARAVRAYYETLSPSTTERR